MPFATTCAGWPAPSEGMRLGYIPGRGWLPAVLGVLLELAACPPAAAAADVQAAMTAMKRGVDWILAHPATAHDGGFKDLVDEALFFRVFLQWGRKCCPDPRLSAARDRALDRLLDSGVMERWIGRPHKSLLDHYHVLLAAYLLEQGGRGVPHREELIAQAERALATDRNGLSTVRLAVALLLRRLGAEPPLSPEALRETGFVARLTAPHSPGRTLGARRALDLHPFVFYALVHEIALLTDFGALQPSPWLASRRAALLDLLEAGVRQALAAGSVDRLSELLLAMDILGGCGRPVVNEAVDFLVSTQLPDGSWGVQTRRRANPVRHAVQTATAALMAAQGCGAGAYAVRLHDSPDNVGVLPAADEQTEHRKLPAQRGERRALRAVVFTPGACREPETS